MDISRLRITGCVRRRWDTAIRPTPFAERQNSWLQRYPRFWYRKSNGRFCWNKGTVELWIGGPLVFYSTKCSSQHLPSEVTTKTKSSMQSSPTNPSTQSTCPANPSQSFKRYSLFPLKCRANDSYLHVNRNDVSARANEMP